MVGHRLEVAQEGAIALFVAKGDVDLALSCWHPPDLFVARYSVLPAISLSGVLHLTIQDRSYNTADFTSFVDMLLDRMSPFPASNSVLIMDNASIHKSHEMVQMVQAR
jgi:hypothetical protein